MVIKGSSRGASATDVERLARHLLSRENEVTTVLEGCDRHDDLARVLADMRAVTLGTRSRRALYHASLSLPADEAFTMDDPRWIEAVDVLERHLSLVGHQRIVVGHSKEGRRHVHVVWCRAHAETLKVASDSQSYRKHEAASRELEQRWDCRPVRGAHTRGPGSPRPVAMATHRDWQAQTRTGISVADVADILQRAWNSTTTALNFKESIESQGLRLARGRRGIIVVDAARTPHSIPRRLGLKAQEIHHRLASLNAMTLPNVDDIKMAAKWQEGRTNMARNQAYGVMAPRRRRPPVSQPGQPPLSPTYWRALGHDVNAFPGYLLVTLSPTTRLFDHGDRLVLDRPGEPTDDEIQLLVAAGRERGWTGIRFYGGSPEWQRRARLEALKQGYSLAQISLECEDGQRPPMAAIPMPRHIKNKLMPLTPEPELLPDATVPDGIPPASTSPTEMRP